MLGKLREAANAARLRAGQMWRERREHIAEKKAAKADKIASQGAPLIWVWFLAIIAASTLIGSTWMLGVFIAGSVGTVDWAIDWRAGNDGEPGRWTWYAEATVHLIIGLGLACFCIGIAAFNAVWLHVRHYLQGLFLHVVTALGVATALFMVAGAIVTQQWGTDARTRDQVSNVGTAQAGVAAINAEILSIETEMARLCAPNLTTYQAQACRSGEIAWAERTETARRQRDAQLGGIERAMADARQGDRWRASLTQLRREAATASVQTVAAETATVVSTGWMATFSRTLEDIRKPFIAVLGELLAMTMFGVALAAWRSRQPYRVPSSQSGWAGEEVQIPDMRDEDKIKPQPMRPAREVVTDAETGEELIKITPKPHWRKQKGKKQKVEFSPDIPPDETGVEHDGGGRVGSVSQVPDLASPEPEATQHGPDAQQGHKAESDEREAIEDGGGNHVEQNDSPSEALSEPELTEAERAEFAMLAETGQPEVAAGEEGSDADDEQFSAEAVHEGNESTPSTQQADDEQKSADESEQWTSEDQTDLPAEREPETNPAKLIAAE